MIYAEVPLKVLVPKLTLQDLYVICERHNIFYTKRHVTREMLSGMILDHVCTNCSSQSSVFEKVDIIMNKKADRQQEYRLNNPVSIQEQESLRYQVRKNDIQYKEKCNSIQRKAYQQKQFPPSPPSQALKSQIIEHWIEDTNFVNIEETGCAVCGSLHPVKQLKSLKHADIDTNILNVSGVTRQERSCDTDPFVDKNGPVLTGNKDSVCTNCFKSLQHNQIPSLALVNGI